MSTRLKDLRLRQVDQSSALWTELRGHRPPPGGWVRSVRQALGMSAAQLGRRMGLTRQAVADLEKREVQRSASLAVLEQAAKAMNAELVYALVPRSSLAETIRHQARTVAERQLQRATHTMGLEAQAVTRDEYDKQLAEHQDALLRTWSRQLWDDENAARE